MGKVIGLANGKTMTAKYLSEATPSELERAWQYCREIARSAAGNFYYAFKFMPLEQRRGIEALYAFARVSDDAVDGEGGNKANLLKKLHQKLDLCFSEGYIDDLTLALAYSIKSFGFERQHFDDLMLGIESDLTVKRYSTFDQMRLYCYRVAATIGFSCLKIFGCDDDNSRLYSENLSIGMQITNILRDLHEDFERGRIYIPQEDLIRFNLSDEDLFAAQNALKLIELVRWEAERAENYFKEADSHLNQYNRKPLFPAMIMGQIYRVILSKIRLLNKFDKRVELSVKEKLTIAKKVFKEALT
ncbi:squalene/phytoene synthase family protein [bacterium]|nr:squalene/phytoene synthase family protein [bacterium]